MSALTPTVSPAYVAVVAEHLIALADGHATTYDALVGVLADRRVAQGNRPWSRRAGRNLRTALDALAAHTLLTLDGDEILFDVDGLRAWLDGLGAGSR